METLLFIVFAMLVAFLAGTSRTREPQIVYVPVEPANKPGGMGCLPLLLLGALALMALGILRI